MEDSGLKQKSLPRLVIINWKDAISPTSGWTDIKELKPNLADCISVGIIITEDENTITTISHISGDKEQTDIDGSLVLDKTWIKEIKYLPIPRSMAERLKKWI